MGLFDFFRKKKMSTDETPCEQVREQDSSIPYLKMAKSGDAESQFRLGIYYTEYSDHQDWGKAYLWFKKAAEQGYADAQYHLYKYSSRFEESGLLDTNKSEYFNWLEKAAEQGHPEAQCDLAGFYWHGENGVKKDPGKGAVLYEKAAEQGHGFAAEKIAEIYENGEFVKRDFKKASYWYRKHYENQHDKSYASNSQSGYRHNSARHKI